MSADTAKARMMVWTHALPDALIADPEGILSTMRSNMSLANWPGFLRVPYAVQVGEHRGALWRISNIHESIRL